MRRTLWTILILVLLVPDAEAGPMVVAVDAGHGGTNLGARSPSGVAEKDITLFMARALARTLGQSPGVRVILTRSGDEYVTLSDRVRTANRARADLFLSLHCNASPGRNQRGFEAFVLSPEAVRRQEGPTARAPLSAVLSDPSRAVAMEVDAAVGDLRRGGLRRIATELGRSLLTALSVILGNEHHRGLQEGRFDVLMGLDMPGVLVELGFLDHSLDSQLLTNRSLLGRMVGALASAVLRHGAERHGLTLQKHPSLGGTSPAPRNQEPPPDRRRPAPGAPLRAVPPKPVVAQGSAA